MTWWSSIKKGDTKVPFLNIVYVYIFYDVVELLELWTATTTAAMAAAATATVVETAAAAPAAAPDAAADVPAAPALLDAPAEAEDCAKDGTDKDITKIIVVIIFNIRIKLTPTFR